MAQGRKLPLGARSGQLRSGSPKLGGSNLDWLESMPLKRIRRGKTTRTRLQDSQKRTKTAINKLEGKCENLYGS